MKQFFLEKHGELSLILGVIFVSAAFFAASHYIRGLIANSKHIALLGRWSSVAVKDLFRSFLRIIKDQAHLFFAKCEFAGKGFEELGRSIGRLIALTICLAPAIVIHHFCFEEESDVSELGLLFIWGGFLLSAYLVFVLLAHFGEEREDERKGLLLSGIAIGEQRAKKAGLEQNK